MKPGYYWAQSKRWPNDPPDIILVEDDGKTFTFCGNEVEIPLDEVEIISEIQPPPAPEHRIDGSRGFMMGKEINAG